MVGPTTKKQIYRYSKQGTGFITIRVTDDNSRKKYHQIKEFQNQDHVVLVELQEEAKRPLQSSLKRYIKAHIYTGH